MKKSFVKFICIVAVLGLGLMSGASTDKAKDRKKAPEITTENNISIDKATHDFGTVAESGGNVTATFTVTNNNKSAILLHDVKASCGCTKPTYTETPIEPGKTGEVKASYNPKGNKGPFEKTVTIPITIIDENKEETVHVKIKGTVEQ
jgi:hypothetical protein